MTTTSSTLGQYMSFENCIETVGVKVRASEDAELKFSVYFPDEQDDLGNRLKVYSATVHLFKSNEFHWLDLPINLYMDDADVQVEITKNSKIDVADETWDDKTLVLRAS